MAWVSGHPLPGPIQAAYLEGAPATLVMRDDLPNGGTLHQWRCDRYPRLIKQVYRGSRTARTVTTWIVDGVRCGDLDEAVRLLNGPVIADDVFELA
jgi:hypothetical protein